MAVDATGGERGFTLSPPREKLFLLALFCSLTLFAVLCTNFPTWSWPGGDGRDYANITEALVEGQSFDLRHSSLPQRNKNDRTVVVAADGSLYSIFPMGKALAQAPMFALGRWITADSSNRLEQMLVDNFSFSVTSAILYGLSGCLLFLLLLHYCQYSFPLSLLGTLLYCLATLSFPFSKIHGVESLLIPLFIAITYFGLRPGKWSLAIVSICFGWAVVTKPPSAIALPVLAYLFFKSNLWGRAHSPSRILALLGAVGFAALLFYYNWLRSGDPGAAYAVGHAADTTFSLTRIPATIWPLLFGPDRNLFLNNPILFLALPGLFMLRNKTYIITAAGLWTSMLLLYGASGNTNWGAYVGNGRYAVPFIFLLMPFVLETLRWFSQLEKLTLRTTALLLSGCLVLCSMYVQLLYASYSEFHVKQFEYRFNHQARQVGIATLEEAKHQLKFAHTLYWHTDSCQQPSHLEYFPYPSREPERARFSGKVLKAFPARFFCKDYLFLNGRAFKSIGWFKTLESWIIGSFLISIFATIVLPFILSRQQRRRTGDKSLKASEP
jgi:hypothetical protein